MRKDTSAIDKQACSCKPPTKDNVEREDQGLAEGEQHSTKNNTVQRTAQYKEQIVGNIWKQVKATAGNTVAKHAMLQSSVTGTDLT
jgi:hypothetical protein